MAEHGTRQNYADGCRCALCKKAQSLYRQDLTARKSGAQVTSLRYKGRPPKGESAPVLVEMPTPGEVGPAEAATLEELSTLTSSETRKGAAQAALAMARILDNPLAISQQPAAAARLTDILEDLRKGSARKKGRLASVQAMTMTSPREKMA